MRQWLKLCVEGGGWLLGLRPPWKSSGNGFWRFQPPPHPLNPLKNGKIKAALKNSRFYNCNATLPEAELLLLHHLEEQQGGFEAAADKVAALVIC